MADDAPTGRWRQKRRTRKDLLEATARLLKAGRRPSLEEVADAAEVSRATVYRYFPRVDALLVEAAVDVAVPDAAMLFAGDPSGDPVERLDRVEAALHGMIADNEVALRVMLASSLERGARRPEAGDLPIRQNRRTPLIEAALEPARDRFAPGDYETLTAALALVIGTEAMVVFRDVLQLDEKSATRVRRWAIRALVAAASDHGSPACPGAGRPVAVDRGARRR